MESGYPDSYYLATARGLKSRSRLRSAERADVCVIGGGYTGLSAALRLAELGRDVVLLEAHRIGWGAAGRNGGQVGSGQRQDEAELEATLGAATAQRLWDLAEAAKRLVRERVERHAIDCDLKDGQLIVAAKPAHAEHLRRRADKLERDYGYAQATYVPHAELPALLGSEAFFGALHDRGAMHLHPLNYALGLARACEEAGVRIYEHSAALDYTHSAPSVVRTSHGTITASQVVLGCDGYLGHLEPRIAARNMPINNYMVATAPLGDELARTLIRNDACVHDTRFVVSYFRLSADRRLLFGGGESYSRGFPPDIVEVVMPYLRRAFPQLGGAKIDYAWGGALGISRTRLPHVGRLEPNVYFAQGFSGHGISIGSIAGTLMAEAIVGPSEGFELLAGLPAPAWPGGTVLRWPLLALGMLYYAMRDRL